MKITCNPPTKALTLRDNRLVAKEFAGLRVQSDHLDEQGLVAVVLDLDGANLANHALV